MGDANWFFSACAQTTGAIVAIIGGFIATRLITMAASEEGTLQALATAELNLEHAQERARSAEQEIREVEASEFRAAVLYRIVEADPRWSREVLLQRYRGNHLDEESLRAIMEDIAQTADTARTAFGQIDDQRIVDMEFEVAVADLANLPGTQNRDVFEEAFLKLRRDARRRWQEQGARGHYVPRPDWWVAPPPSPMDDAVAQGSVRAAMRERLIAAKSDVDRAQAAVEGLRAEAAKSQPARGLAASFAILAYLCAVGVALPLALLPAGESTQPWRVPVLSLLLLGLGALLVLFWRQIRAAQRR